MKKLKQFSYYSQHGSDKGTQYYIMASSQQQVVDLFESIGKTFPISYIRDYFYNAWGTDGEEIMKGLDIEDACIYGIKRENMFSKMTETPKKVAE